MEQECAVEVGTARVRKRPATRGCSQSIRLPSDSIIAAGAARANVAAVIEMPPRLIADKKANTAVAVLVMN